MIGLGKKPLGRAILLVLMAVLLLSTTVTASYGVPLGSITVHKYSRSTAGSVTANTYTGEMLTDTSALGKPLPGAGFTLYKLNMANVDAAIKNGNKYVSHVINPTNNNVTFTLDGAGNPPVTAMPALATVLGNQQLTDTNGTTVFVGLEDGYYVLVETVTPEEHSTCESALIRLPMTKADGTAHNRDIHVYPKNQTTSMPVMKTINGVPQVLNVGDTIKFDVTADFRNQKADPDHVGSVHDLRNDSVTPAVYGEVYLIDMIQEYFSFVSVDSVALLDGVGAQISTLTNGDYAVITTGLLNGSGPLKVKLNPAGIDKAIAVDAASYIVTLTTEFKGATAGDNVAGSAPIKNVVTSFVIKPGSDDTGDWPTAEVFVPTTLIALTKTTSQDAPFAGAKFRLSTVANPSDDADYVKNASGAIIELTTDALGRLSFYNLPYDETLGTTYYLHEIATAPGYQLKVGTIAVTLPPKSADANASQLDGDGNWIDGALVRADVIVKNYRNDEIDPDEPAFSLPLTGGRGVALFTVIGITIMAVATTGYLKKRSLEG